MPVIQAVFLAYDYNNEDILICLDKALDFMDRYSLIVLASVLSAKVESIGLLGSLLKNVEKVLMSLRAVLDQLIRSNPAVRQLLFEVLPGVSNKSIRNLLAIYRNDTDNAVREFAGKCLAVISNKMEKVSLELYCFGQFSGFFSGQPLDEKRWKTRYAKYMFLFLALNRGNYISQDRLIALFWRESSPEKAKQNLQTTITRIRNVFRKGFKDEVENSPEMIIREGQSYALNPDIPCRVDVIEFEKYYHKGMTILQQGNIGDASFEFQKAQRLYTADLLDGIYEDWFIRKREELQEKYLSLILNIADAGLFSAGKTRQRCQGIP